MRILSGVAFLASLLLPAAAGALTVCADPNNLPFSNSRQQGFENRLVAMLAKQLHTQVSYVWWAQRRGFARHTLSEAKCDLWPGVASGLGNMETTRSYYRSTYMFVTQSSRPLGGLTLDDPRLKRLTIGVQLIGYDGINTPPAQALAERGITQNVRGYMLYGNYRQSNPPAAIVNAVADGSVDVALVWGPVAGYFARRAAVPLRLEPVPDDRTWKMAYGVSIGVRTKDTALRQRLDAALSSDRAAIGTLLSSFHIPVVSAPVNLAAH